jgi:diaminohydroxyphosphoribosylaminopyrimidine deaminase/5-amino-6-(5-phosphoribosylamino)uracil reductase
LLAAGIARVVYAIRDPNPRVDGSGAARLQAAGVTTEVGLLQAEAAALNQGFLKRMSLGRPFVRLKTGASLDGRVALANGESRWITSEAARADAQHWRARSSAILTGFGTAMADDPQLNVRLADVERQPLRVLLASSVRVPVSLKMFEPPGRALVIGAVGAGRDGQALRSAGIEVELVEGVAGRLSLPAVLATLAKRQVNEVLVEAGPTLSGALLDASLVDEWLLYLAPKLLGSSARPLADVPSPPRLASAQRFAIVDTARVGDDLRIRLVPGDANDPPPPRLG